MQIGPNDISRARLFNTRLTGAFLSGIVQADAIDVGETPGSLVLSGAAAINWIRARISGV
jgi:hypothetical protein